MILFPFPPECILAVKDVIFYYIMCLNSSHACFHPIGRVKGRIFSVYYTILDFIELSSGANVIANVIANDCVLDVSSP